MRGSSAMGINDVAGMGIGSVIHQNAVSRVTPAVQAAALPSPACATHKPTITPSRGPSQRAICFITYYLEEKSRMSPKTAYATRKDEFDNCWH
jgi:hypothetical protein